MEANAVFFPKTTLSGVLVWLTKKGDLRRWKDPKRGYLYVVEHERGVIMPKLCINIETNYGTLTVQGDS